MASKTKKIEYQTLRVGSCFNHVLELNQKMLILKRFVEKIIVYVMMRTELFIKYFCNISCVVCEDLMITELVI